MPLYTFRNKETGEECELLLSMSEFGRYLLDHPEVVHIIQPISTIDSARLGVTKPDDTFKDILKVIKKRHSSRSIPSTINTF